MYEAYYGFDEKPFALSPDPKYLFLSSTHREVLGHLLYGIEQGEGFMAISGEVGTGKTTLCRTLLDRLGASCEIAFLFNPTLTPTDLIKAINAEFDLSTFGDSRPELLDVLNTFLLEKNAEGRRVLVIIDEAQNLPRETLEQLRLLSNLESRTAKLLQIILIGQPELDEILEQNDLRQLRQRITVWWRLGPLTQQETREYVRHRLRVAAGGDRPLFAEPALALVHRLTRGVPRLVNVLCDRSLLAGYGDHAPQITPAIVREAAREIRLDPAPAARPDRRRPSRGRGRGRRIWRRLGLAAAAGAGIGALLLLGWWAGRGGLGAAPSVPGPSSAPSAASAPRDTPPVAAAAPLRPEPAAVVPVAAPAPPPAEPEGPALVDDPLDNLLSLSEARETNGLALAALLEAWGLPVEETGSPSIAQLLATLEVQGLRVVRVDSFDETLRLGLPVLVQLPGRDGDLRAVLLRHVEGEQIQLEGLVPGQLVRTTRADLAGRWSGDGYVAWRDYEGLPPILRSGQSGEAVSFVQRALARLGHYVGDVHGSFDDATERAVMAFQRDAGLDVDGAVGPFTQVRLYHALPDYRMPLLALGPGARSAAR